MANQEHLDILEQGVETWNLWRKEHIDIQLVDLRDAHLEEIDLHRANLTLAHLSGAHLFQADLRNADLSGAHLSGAHLSGAHLSGAHLWEANLAGANLSGADLGVANLIDADFTLADLRNADLTLAHLTGAQLINSDLRNANLTRANLTRANLTGANLSGADLTWSNISEANCREANLTGCKIYAISAWNVDLQETIQTGLIITRDDEVTISVDNLEVGQFIYLLLNNPKIRDVIDSITSKVVLILGRFTHERKPILDALREALRKRNYSPVLFDFEKPASRDLTETVSTLAHMARFVIADITDAKSIPQELKTIVPNLPSVPILPLILDSQHEYGMFEHFTRFPWVLPIYRYADEGSLLKSLQEKVITPAEQKAKELEKR